MNDKELQERYQNHTARAANGRAHCLAPEELVSVSRPSKDGPPPEHDRIVDHLVGCSSCSAELKMIRSLDGWTTKLLEELDTEDSDVDEERKTKPRAWLVALAAASTAAALGLGFWAARLSQESDALRAASTDARDALARADASREDLERRIAALTEPQLNVTLFELDSDASLERGSAGDAPILTVRPTDPFFNLILHPSKPLAADQFHIELLTEDGELVFQADGLLKGDYDTFTLALSPASLAEGEHRLRLLEAESGKMLEQFSFRIVYRTE